MSDAISKAEARWNITLKRKSPSSDEWCGPCPWCGGTDRFLVWEAGNYWCREGGKAKGCGRQGWVDEEEVKHLSDVERRVRELEREQARAQREREDMERRLTALEEMAAQWKVALAYHDNLGTVERSWWYGQGIHDDAIGRFALGYCPRCPTDHLGRASYTIPVTKGATLLNIRHRLEGAEKGDKYRPHMRGLGLQLFNQDAIEQGKERGELVILEGEKKVIVWSQYLDVLPPASGIMGKRSFKREWLQEMEGIERIYIALDPDAIASAHRLAAHFKGRAWVVEYPAKPDELIYRYGCTPTEMREYLRWSRRYIPDGRN